MKSPSDVFYPAEGKGKHRVNLKGEITEKRLKYRVRECDMQGEGISTSHTRSNLQYPLLLF